MAQRKQTRSNRRAKKASPKKRQPLFRRKQAEFRPDKQTKEFIVDRNGEVVINRTLWISDWKKSKTPYVDHSLDEYDVD